MKDMITQVVGGVVYVILTILAVWGTLNFIAKVEKKRAEKLAEDTVTTEA